LHFANISHLPIRLIVAFCQHISDASYMPDYCSAIISMLLMNLLIHHQSLSLRLMTLSCLAFAVSSWLNWCCATLLALLPYRHTCFLTWSILAPYTTWSILAPYIGLACFDYSVLPFLLFIIPLVPKLLYRSTRITSLSVSEWLYNIDIGIETLRSR
jgi:hypothetical protein